MPARVSLSVTRPVCLILVLAVFQIADQSFVCGQTIIDDVLPAEEAARTMVVPDGFNVTLFADVDAG